MTWLSLKRWLTSQTKRQRFRQQLRDEVKFEWRAEALESRLLFDGDPVIADPILSDPMQEMVDSPAPIVGAPAIQGQSANSHAANAVFPLITLSAPDPNATIRIGDTDVGRGQDLAASLAASSESSYEINVADDVVGLLQVSLSNNTSSLGRIVIKSVSSGKTLMTSDDLLSNTVQLDVHLEPGNYTLELEHVSQDAVDANIRFTPAIAPVLGQDQTLLPGKIGIDGTPIVIEFGNFFQGSSQDVMILAIDTASEQNAIFSDGASVEASIFVGSILDDGSYSPRTSIAIAPSPLNMLAANFSGDGMDEIAVLYANRVEIFDATSGEMLGHIDNPLDDGDLRNFAAGNIDVIQGTKELVLVNGHQAAAIFDPLGAQRTAVVQRLPSIPIDRHDGFQSVVIDGKDVFLLQSLLAEENSTLHWQQYDGSPLEPFTPISSYTPANDLSINAGLSFKDRMKPWNARLSVDNLTDSPKRYVVGQAASSSLVWVIGDSAIETTTEAASRVGKLFDVTGNGLKDFVTDQLAVGVNSRGDIDSDDRLDFTDAYTYKNFRENVSAFAVGYLNVDERADLIYGLRQADDSGALDRYVIQIALGTTNNNYQFEQTDQGITRLFAIASDDFNRDGNSDFISLDSGGEPRFFEGVGNGLFLDPKKLAGSINTSGYRSDVVTGDFNQDGRTDMAVFHHRGKDAADNEVELLFYLGDGTGTFVAVPGAVGTVAEPLRLLVNQDFSSSLRLATVDFNQDEVLDFVVAYVDQNNRLVVSVYDGSKALTKPELLANWTGDSIPVNNAAQTVLATASTTQGPRISVSTPDGVIYDLRDSAGGLTATKIADAPVDQKVVDLDWIEIADESRLIVTSTNANALQSRVEVFRQTNGIWGIDWELELFDDVESAPTRFTETIVVDDEVVVADVENNVIYVANTDPSSRAIFPRMSVSKSPERLLQVGDRILFGNELSGFATTELTGEVQLNQEVAQPKPIVVDLLNTNDEQVSVFVTVDASGNLKIQKQATESTIEQQIFVESGVLAVVQQAIDSGSGVENTLVIAQRDIITQNYRVSRISFRLDGDLNVTTETKSIEVASAFNGHLIAGDGITTVVINKNFDSATLQILAADGSGASSEIQLDNGVGTLSDSILLAGDRILIGDPLAGEIMVYGLDGKLIQRLSSNDHARVLSDTNPVDVAGFGGTLEMFVVDVDNDGMDDLVVLNKGDRSVTIRDGLSPGLFGAVQQTIRLAHEPLSLEVTDVDGDQNLDLVITQIDDYDFDEDVLEFDNNNDIEVTGNQAATDTNEILVYYGAGDGLFQQLNSVDSTPESIRVTSLSNGNQPTSAVRLGTDLVLTNEAGDVIQLEIEGSDRITPFDSKSVSQISTNTLVELDVQFVGVDGNEVIRVATSSNLSDQVTVQRFQAGIDNPIAGQTLQRTPVLRDSANLAEQVGAEDPESVQLIDVVETDPDGGIGTVDLVYTNTAANQLVIHEGYIINGELLFGDAKFYAVGTSPLGFTVAGNEDPGNLDSVMIAVANQGSNDVSVVYPSRNVTRNSLRLLTSSDQNAVGLAFSDTSVNADLLVQLEDVDGNSQFVKIDNTGNGFFNDQALAGFAAAAPVLDVAFVGGNAFALLNNAVQRFDFTNEGTTAKFNHGGDRLRLFTLGGVQFAGVRSTDRVDFLNIDGGNETIPFVDLENVNDFEFHEPSNLLYLVDSDEVVTTQVLKLVTSSLDLSGLFAAARSELNSDAGGTVAATIDEGGTADDDGDETLIVHRDDVTEEETSEVEKEEADGQPIKELFRMLVSLIDETNELVDGWSSDLLSWQADVMSESTQRWAEIGLALGEPYLVDPTWSVWSDWIQIGEAAVETAVESWLAQDVDFSDSDLSGADADVDEPSWSDRLREWLSDDTFLDSEEDDASDPLLFDTSDDAASVVEEIIDGKVPADPNLVF
ncbi:MAG: VCBS repeat-containing protein [Pirellulaceae bacterium]